MKRPLNIFLLLYAATGGAVFAEGYLRGPERPISPAAAGPQLNAKVAVREGGDFMVVWSGYGGGYTTGIFGRRFDQGGTPLGPSFQISTYTTYSQEVPAVAAGEGIFFVVWNSYGDGSSDAVFGRTFDVNGPLGPPFQVNTYTTGSQFGPSVATDGSGTFIVVWASPGQDGSSEGIVGRLLDRRGVGLSPEFIVNTYTTGDQQRPAVDMDASGEFVVTWDSAGLDGSGRGVAARRFNAFGTPGSEFLVNTYTEGYQLDPSVGIGRFGVVTVTWVSQDQDGSVAGVFGARFDGTDAPIGLEFQVNTYTTETQREPSIAVDPAGAFAIVWESYGQDGSDFALSGRRYDSTGASIGGEFAVNTYTTSAQASPAIAADPRGNFVVVWQSYEQDGSDYGVFGQPLAGPPLVMDPASGGAVDCSDPSTIRPTIAWDPSQYDKYRVFVAWDPTFAKGKRLTSGDRYLTSPAWTPTLKKWRQACARALAENPSSPVLYIQVYGLDDDLARNDTARKNFGNVRQVDVLP